MAYTKKIAYIPELILLFLYISLYPLGKLLSTTLFSQQLNVIDTLSILSIPIFIIKKDKLPSLYLRFTSFLMVAAFSFMLSLLYFSFKETLAGLFYLIRLFSYFTLSAAAYRVFKYNKNSKEIFFKLFYISLLIFSLIGWYQYFVFSDLTTLKYAGWDDHLGRLVSTLLDPAFAGIILVFATLTSMIIFFKKNKYAYLLLAVYFFVTMMFTYSRASYIAFLGVALYHIFRFIKLTKLIFTLILLFLLLPFLPRPKSEGVRLERTFSIFAKAKNYQETFLILKKYPLFGVGFNNICSVRERYFFDDASSHACHGADSSLLFILATTGIIGFLIFFNFAISAVKETSDNIYGILIKSSGVALLIHSFFANSMFYNFVMGYFAIILPLGLRSKK